MHGSTSLPSSDDLLFALCTANLAARAVYLRALRDGDSPGVRALKLYLGERHTEHFKEIREAIYASGGVGRTLPQQDTVQLSGLSNDVVAALTSANRALVLAMCGLVEERLRAEYARAVEQLPAGTPYAVLAQRHFAELEQSGEFIARIETERRLAEPLVPARELQRPWRAASAVA